MPEPGEQDRPRLGVSWVQVAASAAASVTAAVVASVFGVAGTIVGTVVVSVVATAGSAVYNASLRRTHVRLRQARERITQQSRAYSEPSHQPVDGTSEPLTGKPESPLPTPRATRRSASHGWRRRTPLAVGVVAVLVAAMAVVTAVELINQKPLGALVGPSKANGGLTFFGGRSSGSTRRPAPTTTVTVPALPGGTLVPTTLSPSPSSSTTATITTTTSPSQPTTTLGQTPQTTELSGTTAPP